MSGIEQFILSAIEHAKEDKDHEICGLVVIHKGKKEYIRCDNVAVDKTTGFIISPKSWVLADERGEIVSVVHSHPDKPPIPSQADLIGCEKSGLPWVIVNPNTEEHYTFEPTGYQAPLYGREYRFNVMDCYTFVQDYYKLTYGLHLRDYEREEDFWEKGQNLYIDHLVEEGFYPIQESEVLPGDAILLTIGSNIANHAAVYVGDNLIGHHLQDKLSSRDVYGSYYRKHTHMFVRHKDINQ